MVTDHSKLSNKELATEAEALAKQRTAVRLSQNAVQTEQDVRRAIRGLPPSTGEIVRLRLAGQVGSAGATTTKEN